MQEKPQYDPRKDRELWVVAGTGWTIPVFCVHCVFAGTPSFHVRSAVHIGFSQAEALEHRLLGAGAHVLNNGWLLSQADFSNTATKAPGITPEFYYSWDGERISELERKRILGDEPEIKKKRKEYRADNAFLAHVATRSGIDFDLLVMSWLAIVQALPEWLLSCKTLDMGSIRLTALPYRHNWKQLLTARFPLIQKVMLVSEPKSLLRLTFTAAARAIRVTELTMCRMRRQRALFGWTVEVQHDSSWEKVVEEVEEEAASRLTATAYLKRWASKVAQQEDVIYEILAEAVKKEGAPTCRLLWRRGESGPRVVQAAPTILRTPQIDDCDEGGGQSLDDFTGVGDSARYLEDAAARLLQMSVAEPAVDLRVSGGADGGGAEPGLLVPDPGGGEAAGEGVLAGNDGAEGDVDLKQHQGFA